MLKITVKNPNTKQFQMEYAMYMMLTSYFRKTKCTTKVLEDKLHLYYAEMPDTKQVELEKKIEKFLEVKVIPEIIEKLGLEVQEDLARLDATVAFKNYGNHHLMVFRGEDFTFALDTKLDGTRFIHRLS